jgi:hypothetical protein
MAITIQGEIKRGNALLDELDTGLFDFERILKRSMRRLQALHENASSRHMIFLALFVVLVLLVLYFLIR